MGVMSNRDHLVDGLHSILEELWEGSDQIAASEFRKLMVWRARAIKPSVPTYMAGTFPAPVSQDAQDLSFLESVAAGMRSIDPSNPQKSHADQGLKYPYVASAS